MIKNLPNGVQHLYGNLYKVKFDLIQPPVDIINSRCAAVDIGIANSANGLNQEDMSKLIKSIQADGLQCPLSLNFVERDDVNCLELIVGKRRSTAISHLLQQNAICKNLTTGETKSAKEVYEFVECRINQLSYVEAQKLNYQENSTSCPIGDGADAAFIKMLRVKNLNDEQILEITGKSIQWLREADKLCRLDKTCFESLCRDEINRTVGLTLEEIEDVNERLERLDVTLQMRDERKERQYIKAEEDLAKALDKEDIAASQVKVLKKFGSKDELENAEQKLEKSKKRTSEKRKARKEVEGENAATAKDLKAANKKLGKDDNFKAIPLNLRPAKIKKLYIDVIDDIIKNDGKDQNNVDILDVESLRLVKCVLNGVMQGEKDVFKLFKRHVDNILIRQKRAEKVLV